MKHSLALLIVFSFAIAVSQTVPAQMPVEKPVRVLLVDDPSSGYYYMGTATALRDIIRQDKRFEVVLVEDAEMLGTDLLFDYDVIVLHFKNYKTPKRNAAMQENLEKFVTEGGGLFVYHFACGAFEDWKPGFEKLAGRIWDPALPGHDPYGRFTVQITDNTHPITKNISNFEIQDELYTCLNDSKVPIQVIADAVSVVDKKTYPMAFVLENGKGRTFHTTLGHDDRSLSAAGFQTMIRQAILWCAKRENLAPPAPANPAALSDTTDARLREITDALPEGAKLLAYLDCGGPGRFEQGLKIALSGEAKPWRWQADAPLADVPPQQMTVLFHPQQVSFVFEGLDRSKRYQLNVVWWDFDANGRVQSLIVQSPDQTQIRILRPGISLPDFKESKLPPRTLSVPLPLAFVRDGKLLLNVRNESGPNAVVNEIWINELVPGTQLVWSMPEGFAASSELRSAR